MKLYQKLNLMALSVLLFVGLTIAIAGFHAISQLTYQFYWEVMTREVENVLVMMESAHSILEKNRLDKLESYIDQAQKDVLEELNIYQYRNTGQLMIVKSDMTVKKHEILSAGDKIDIPYTDKLMTLPEGYFEVEYHGKKRLFRFQRYPAWDWVVVLAVDSEEVLSVRTKFLNRVIFILTLAVFLGALVVIWYTKRMTRPIRQLADATTYVSEGKWETPLPKPKGRDEIAMLTRAFQQMASRLARMYTDLETNLKEIENSQKALRDSEERYKSMFENTGAGTVISEGDMLLSMVNAGFEQITGYSREEIEGKMKWIDFIVPEDQERLRNYHYDRRKNVNDPPDLYECDMIDRQGNRKNMVIKVGLIPGTQIGIASFIDITEQKQAQSELEKSEAHVRLLLDSTGEGILGLDNHNICTFANSASAAMLGYESTGDLIGRDMHELSHSSTVSGSDTSKASCPICKISNAGHPTHTDSQVLWTKNDQMLHVSYRSHPIFNQGQVIGSVVTFLDISDKIQMNKEKKYLERQLMQSQKMEAIGALAGGIAHDFNNILSGIFAYSQLAQAHIDNPGKAIKHIDEILVGAKRATELVQQILTFSRQTEYKKIAFQAKSAAKETLKLLRSTIPTTIEIKETLISDSIIMADPTKIHQVIMNLSTNAYHAMAETGGILTVSLKDRLIPEPQPFLGKQIPGGTFLELLVKDTGMGMDEAVLEKIFDPYFTTKKRGKGTGFGLSIVQAIVDEHEGFLQINSVPGQGTEICVCFPCISKKASRQPLAMEKASALPGKETVMVVDDEASIRLSFKEILNDHGYTVYEYDNPMDAFADFKTRKEGIDLILTDMTMPGMTGLDLIDRVHEVRPEMPSVLCSGFSSLINDENLSRSGVNQYLSKPVLQEKLVAAVRDAIDGKSHAKGEEK